MGGRVHARASERKRGRDGRREKKKWEWVVRSFVWGREKIIN